MRKLKQKGAPEFVGEFVRDRLRAAHEASLLPAIFILDQANHATSSRHIPARINTSATDENISSGDCEQLTTASTAQKSADSQLQKTAGKIDETRLVSFSGEDVDECTAHDRARFRRHRQLVQPLGDRHAIPLLSAVHANCAENLKMEQESEEAHCLQFHGASACTSLRSFSVTAIALLMSSSTHGDKRGIMPAENKKCFKQK